MLSMYRNELSPKKVNPLRFAESKGSLIFVVNLIETLPNCSIVLLGDDGATNHHHHHRQWHQLQTAFARVLNELERSQKKGK